VVNCLMDIRDKERMSFMPDEKQVSLVQMRAGQSGMVLRIDGGHGMVNRLSTLGIILGKKITKISSMLMRGPVMIEVDRTQVALGFGMAKRILIQLANSTKE
jgi:ferrous iron transport protein A